MRLAGPLLLAAALALGGGLALRAQSGGGTADPDPAQAAPSPEISFNLFALEGFGRFQVHDFDASYTEQFGIAVPAPFRLAVPLNDALELISDGKPDSGFVKFTWVADAEGDRRFVENIAVYAADWGPGASPVERRAEVLALIRDRIFAQATAPHGGGDLKGWGEGEVGGLPAVQAAGTYTDATWGPMLLRIVAVPNPNPGPSYFMLNNISLAMVPVVHLDQMRSTLGGQAITTFRYLPAN